jgi:DNA-binding phage protein
VKTATAKDLRQNTAALLVSRKLKAAVSRSHEEATVESFRKDPAFAAEYLNAVFEDGDQEELMLALRRMSEAFGGVQKLAPEGRS